MTLPRTQRHLSSLGTSERSLSALCALESRQAEDAGASEATEPYDSCAKRIQTTEQAGRRSGFIERLRAVLYCSSRVAELQSLGDRTALEFIMFLLSEIYFYWAWLLLFAAIAFCGARYLGWLGVAAAALLIGVMIVFIEFHSVVHDMREYPDSGRDIDGPFFIGVIFRVGFYNALVLPVSIIGIRLRARSIRVRGHAKVA